MEFRGKTAEPIKPEPSPSNLSVASFVLSSSLVFLQQRRTTTQQGPCPSCAALAFQSYRSWPDSSRYTSPSATHRHDDPALRPQEDAQDCDPGGLGVRTNERTNERGGVALSVSVVRGLEGFVCRLPPPAVQCAHDRPYSLTQLLSPLALTFFLLLIAASGRRRC
jgi:hypothetical protein